MTAAYMEPNDLTNNPDYLSHQLIPDLLAGIGKSIFEYLSDITFNKI